MKFMFLKCILLLLIYRVYSQYLPVRRNRFQQCGPNEEFNECGTQCGQSCDDADREFICPLFMCRPGCFCIRGFFRNRRGRCVTQRQCLHELVNYAQVAMKVQSIKEFQHKKSSATKSQCPADEIYSECGSHCSESCDNINSPTACSPDICDTGCFCKFSLRRNHGGICVHESECNAEGIDLTITRRSDPKECPKNEKYKKCGCHCLELCMNRDNPGVCPLFKKEVGCFCIKGFFRNKEGYCVEEESCDLEFVLPVTPPPTQPPPTSPKCPYFEEYMECGNRCLESMLNIDNPSVCSQNKCHTGCFCIHNWYRDSSGACTLPIPTTTTTPPPPSCPNSEQFDKCGSRCLESCDNSDNPSVCPLDKCEIGCFCKSGLYRDDTGNCIPQPQCEVEELETEPPPPPPTPLTPAPKPSCPEHEQYNDCESRCLESIVNMDNPSACPSKLCDIGCFCTKGFYRDQTGICVEPQSGILSQIRTRPPTTTPDSDQSNQNSGTNIRVHKSSSSQFEYKSSGAKIYSPPTTTTTPTTTLPAMLCPKGEVFNECGSRCIENCINFNNPSVCSPNRCDIGCFCIKGLYRDETGICVPIELCEAEIETEPPTTTTQRTTPTCPHFEIYNECGNRCLESIDSIVNPSECQHDKCDTGCFCIHGFYRDNKGICTIPVTTTTTPEPIPSCPQHEAYTQCGNRCLESIDSIDNPSACPPNRCDTGCFCIHGFYRDKFNACIKPESGILSPVRTHPSCPPNEQFDECGTRCGESCEEVHETKSVCGAQCDKGCFCKEGFLRNCFGDCVEKKDCDSEPPDESGVELDEPSIPPSCPANENFDECGSRCLESCVNVDNPEVCRPNMCDVGCFCQKSFLRNEGGICVTIELCHLSEPQSPPPPPPLPPICPASEEYSKCGSRCLESCDNIDNPSVCPPNMCDIGCFCNKGLNRDEGGICVPEPECEAEEPEPLPPPPPPPICPISEEYSDCGSRCLESCINVDNPTVCPLNRCDIGCFCKRGLYRNEGEICVPIELCELPIEPITSMTTTEATCPTTHPPQCPADEDYSECKSRCLELCVNKDDPSVCAPNRCDVGCFCRHGLYRDDEGFCVPAPGCQVTTTTPCTLPPPPKCPIGEQFHECASRCAEFCINSDDPSFCPSDVCEIGCFCMEGMFRDHLGICVPKNQCDLKTSTLTPEPPQQCNENEEFDECGTHCGENCEIEVNEQTNSVCDSKCEKGCFCREGFLRNCFGTCVQKKDCDLEPPDESGVTIEIHKSSSSEFDHKSSSAKSENTNKVCGHNEEYTDCGDECGKTCSHYNKNPKCEKKCRNGCFCISGYLRNDDGECVNPEKCSGSLPEEISAPPPTPRCPTSEEFKECGNLCLEDCDNIDNLSLCEQDKCDTGCFCKMYFFRNKLGICVPQPECEVDEPEPPPPPMPPAPEVGGPERSTPPPPVVDVTTSPPTQPKCPAFEEFKECGSRCVEACNNIDKLSVCQQNKCDSGCFCKKHLFRDGSGKCVPEPQCEVDELEPPKLPPPPSTPPLPEVEETEPLTLPPPRPPKPPKIAKRKCGRNEHYTECGSQCGESCKITTDAVQESCPPDCKPGCFCDEGLLRDKYKRCIPQDQCSCDLPPMKCPGKNENYFSCFNECGRTCKDFDQKTDNKCPDKCARGCFCREGYVRNEKGICVKPESCDKSKNTKRCSANQVYSECGTECGHQCFDVGKKVECNNNCKSGCFCEKGYFRANDGHCVTAQECDDGGVVRVGHNKPMAECDVTEEYSECANFCDENCVQTLNIANCPLTCEKGCRCIAGHKRTKKGICVPIEECKQSGAMPKCGLHETYSDCGASCGYRCSDINKDIQCKLECEKGCFCDNDYYRDNDGVCILKKNCVPDPIQCNENEIYSKCSKHCGETCEDLLNPIKCPDECEKGCFCRKGFFRDIEGHCGPIAVCNLPTTSTPKPTCKLNEEYSECGNKCEESCQDSMGCPAGCQVGCFCSKGFLRNKAGLCIPDDHCKKSEECTQCDPISEYYSSCGSDCGQFCSDFGKIPECEVKCNKGCFCKYGFYRNEMGKCIEHYKCTINRRVPNDKGVINSRTGQDIQIINYSQNLS